MASSSEALIEIRASDLKDTIRRLCLEANRSVRPDVFRAIQRALAIEPSPLGKRVLGEILKNAQVASEENLPLCQDTGYVTVVLETGSGVRLPENVAELADEGVREAYLEGCFRKSMVSKPLGERMNTKDNTPASVHLEQTDGDRLRVRVLVKGAGSENASVIRMLPVSGGTDALRSFVLEALEKAALACPPVVVGVGVGGSLDTVGWLAKKALFRSLDDVNPDEELAELEQDLLRQINETGVGPGGLGGRTTALGVKIEQRATHMACLPAAVNFNCHALRYAEAILPE